MLLIGKPSISISAIYTMAMLVITRGQYVGIQKIYKPLLWHRAMGIYRLILGADETPLASLGGDGDRWAKFQDFNMKLERLERLPTQCFMLTIVEMIVFD